MSNRQINFSVIYHALAAVGLMATWYYNGLYILGGGGLGPAEFFGTAFANALTTAITIDVYCSALVFSVWVVTDAKRMGLRRSWLYVVVCFCIGLAVALPLYLAQRERLIASNA